MMDTQSDKLKMILSIIFSNHRGTIQNGTTDGKVRLSIPLVHLISHCWTYAFFLNIVFKKITFKWLETGRLSKGETK